MSLINVRADACAPPPTLDARWFYWLRQERSREWEKVA